MTIPFSLEIAFFIILFFCGIMLLIGGLKIFIQGWKQGKNNKRNFKKILLGVILGYSGKIILTIIAIKIFFFFKS